MKKNEFKKDFKETFDRKHFIEIEEAYNFLAQEPINFNINYLIEGQESYYEIRTEIRKKNKFYSIVFDQDFEFSSNEYTVDTLWELIKELEILAKKTKKLFE